MDILLRESQPSDFPFLREMLYEAIFWRAGVKKPSFEEGLAFPDSVREIAEWGERDGDTAVIAALMPFRSVQHGIDSGLIVISPMDM